MNTKKTIGITVILAIAVSLLLTSGAYAQNSVSFSGDTGSTFRGEGSSASEGKACSSSDDPQVSKEAYVYLDGPGYDEQCACGYISAEAGSPDNTADDPYMFVEVDCEQVDVSIDIRGADGLGWADAGISAEATLDGVYTDIWAEAHADSGPGRARAKASAKAEGSAHAELDASGDFYDVAVLTADAEGIARADACSTNRGDGITHAWTRSGISADAEFGSLEEEAGIYSSGYVEGAGPRSVARADSSATGSASASGFLLDCGVVVEWSEVDVDGTAKTHESIRGEGKAWAFADAGSVNYVESWEYLDLYPYVEIDAALIDFSWIDSDSEADVYGRRSSARAEGYVSADTSAFGWTSKPDVCYDSYTEVSGEAGSHVSVVKDGEAESQAGAIALNVVDGFVFVYPIFEEFELDMLDVTGLGSLSTAEGYSSRTRIYTHGWVEADTFAGSSMFVEDTWPPCPPPCPPPSPELSAVLADSATSGKADQVIKGRGEEFAASAAGAGSIAASNVDGIEDFAAVGIGTGVEAPDGSRIYPVACLSDVETSAATYNLIDWEPYIEERVSAEITGGSGNSWLNPRRNLGGSVVSGALVLSPDGTVITDVDNYLGFNPNEAYGYLAGYTIITP